MLVAAGAAATVSILFWNTGETYDTPLRPGPSTAAPQPKGVRLTEADQAAVVRTAAQFVDTAVKRERLLASYELVTPALRQGLTRAEWAKGEIPVQFFPVDAARWKLDYSYADEVGLQVYLVPRRGAGLRPAVFYLSLRALGPRAHRRWLVDSFVPRAVGTGQAAASGYSAIPRAPTGGVSTGDGSKAALSAAWLAVPGALVLGIVLVPAVILLRERRRTRRAERDYLASIE